MTLKIISSEKILFEGEVQSVTLPGTMGRFTVLPRHASLISTLEPGKISYRDSEDEHFVEVSGGIADIVHDIISVCVC